MVYHKKRWAACTALMILYSISFAAISPIHAVSGFPDTLQIENGFISGVKNKDGDVAIFKGVPYAAPPIGNLRWKAPQPAASWKGVRACNEFPASAVQIKPFPFSVYSKEFLAPQEPINEDCLYLNVWAPAKPSSQKNPVIVWIHGGGFMSGSGSVPVYDGEAMAKRGIVFVTINYRLGIFGFFAHPELTKESGHHASGNYAFLDEIAALQWVKNNIAAFGGDPARITVAGQSAGAFSVNALVASPLAKGLFQRAIAESGGMFVQDLVLNLKDAEAQGNTIMQKLNATSIAELRAKPAVDLLKAGMVNRPVIDGYVLPESVYEIFSAGKQNDVPVLTGWNVGDGSLLFLMGSVQNAEKFKTQAHERYGNLADEFLRAFPAASDTQALQSEMALMRDQIFAWQAHLWASFQTTTGKSNIYIYQFDHTPPGKPELAKYGAFHSAEIAYALHTLHEWERPWDESDKKLEDIMSSYWINFASNGNPNGQGLPEWPAYNKQKQEIMDFIAQPTIISSALQPEFDFLDKYNASLKK